MIPLLNFKSIAIAFVVGTTFGGITAWRATSILHDARDYKAELANRNARIAVLEKRMKLALDTTDNDRERAAELTTVEAREKERLDALRDALTENPVIGLNASQRLREIWGK